MQLRVLSLKHFSFDDDSVMKEWAARSGHRYTVAEPHLGQALPSQDSFDLLIVCGGPMSVYEEEANPWLRPEKSFLKQAIADAKPVLGICLGAQLIAEALGAKVSRNRHKEIGWHPIKRTDSGHPLFRSMPPAFHSFQWHGDCFELPEGCERLATNECAQNQAFAYGDRVLALQFHLEPTPASIEAMVGHWASELTDGPYIQSAQQIRSGLARCADSARMLGLLLDALADSLR
ncbi:type 1 glutamine amidotransferase [Paenibacillus thailandensis]|uniref:Type 1 glutamine amidotransferase n=1 Tax=Paenibacillus thailandensis TaxID=393250 RepID=A0ABW5QTG8_9BACL